MKILISLMVRFYRNIYKNLGIEGNFHENLKAVKSLMDNSILWKYPYKY